MERFDFDPEDLEFDIFQLIERLENEHERMIMRIPKMKRKSAFIYEFTAIFSDYSLLEATMMMIPRFNYKRGMEAEIHVQGVYL